MMPQYVVRPNVWRDPSTGIWIAAHAELDVATQGTTNREAREAILSAVRFVLRHHGIEAHVTHAWRDG